LKIENLECKFISSGEEQFYRGIEKSVSNLFNKILSKGKYISYENILLWFLRMRQATIHPQIILDAYIKCGVFSNDIKRWKGDTTKFRKLREIIEKERGEQRKIIIFTQYTSEIDMLEQLIIELGLSVYKFDGRTSNNNRKKVCSGEISPDVLLIQIVAGGCGLNLQAYSRVFIVSPDWNPCNEFQAIARAYRNGQRRDVKVTRLLLKYSDGSDTIDQRIMNIQKRKTVLQSEILKDEDLLKTHNYEMKPQELLNELSMSNFKDLLLL
jgi:SNF2 family DNA or RNA helicase